MSAKMDEACGCGLGCLFICIGIAVLILSMAGCHYIIKAEQSTKQHEKG